jgi:selenocysteine lyase/cysteine desulfurase
VIARFPKIDASATARTLRDQKVVVAARHGGLRVSPHFYNDDEDLMRLETALKNLL